MYDLLDVKIVLTHPDDDESECFAKEHPDGCHKEQDNAELLKLHRGHHYKYGKLDCGENQDDN